MTTRREFGPPAVLLVRNIFRGDRRGFHILRPGTTKTLCGLQSGYGRRLAGPYDGTLDDVQCAGCRRKYHKLHPSPGKQFRVIRKLVRKAIRETKGVTDG